MINVYSSGVLMSFEENSATDRSSHILAYDYSGSQKWDLPLVSDKGAYIYTHRIATEASVFVVGTDDARVSVFHLR